MASLICVIQRASLGDKLGNEDSADRNVDNNKDR